MPKEPADKDTIVVDLDGTLCNVDHRRHLVEQKKWNEFYDLADKDTCNEWCAELIKAFSRMGYFIALVSARPKRCFEATTKWLEDNCIEYDSLDLVRADKDFRPDVTLKSDWARKYKLSRIQFAVDDRGRVVQMWRKLGVTCLQCEDWAPKPGIDKCAGCEHEMYEFETCKHPEYFRKRAGGCEDFKRFK